MISRTLTIRFANLTTAIAIIFSVVACKSRHFGDTTLSASGVSETRMGSPLPFVKKESLIPWMDFPFTDPAKFDPSKFTFVVHGTENLAPNRSLNILEGRDDAPLFASLISQDMPMTYGVHGLILKVAAHEIVGTSLKDTMFDFNNKRPLLEQLEKYAENYPVLHPKALAAAIEIPKERGVLEMLNNEIVLHNGRQPSNTTRIVGAFIWRDAKGAALGDDGEKSEAQVFAFAKAKNIPVVIFRMKDAPYVDTKYTALGTVRFLQAGGQRVEFNPTLANSCLLSEKVWRWRQGWTGEVEETVCSADSSNCQDLVASMTREAAENSAFKTAISAAVQAMPNDNWCTESRELLEGVLRR